MPPQRRKSSIGGGPAAPTRNPLADEAEHTPPVSPLRDAEWHSTAVGSARAISMPPKQGATAPPTAPAPVAVAVADPPAAVPDPSAPESDKGAATTDPSAAAANPGAAAVNPDAAADPGAAAAGPGAAVAGPGTAVAGPGTAVAGPGTAVAGPNAAVAGPNAAVVGPNAAVAGPNAAVAGPNAAVAGPNAAVAGPNAAVADLPAAAADPAPPTGTPDPAPRGNAPKPRGIDPALRSVGSTLRGAATASPSVLTMPLPAAGDGPLNAGELEQLDLCESSIDALRVAFWVAGRALQIVRDGRLYRADHATFDEYVEKRWDMQRSYAHKLIRAWPLAARLHPLAPSINEGQIRELLPIVAAHGEDAAVTVYTTLAADLKVTAGKLREAVAVLPAAYDRSAVVELLQSWMRGDLAEESPQVPDVFSTAESRLAALTPKVVQGSSGDPIAAREFATKLRTLAELIEKQLPITTRMPVNH
ncbi:hypothetical protein [Nocardia sp. NBC_01388]|uniref:hypothetical protein n=1 Tax=Nocardia sp. NBC_01388 TaxID=2903596 RepID=UPI00325060F0